MTKPADKAPRAPTSGSAAAPENAKKQDDVEFAHDLAEDAPPKDLATVKAATDAKEADDQKRGT